MRLDGKVFGTLYKNNGQPIPEDEFIVLRPADNAVLPTLGFYLNECGRLGAGQEQIDGVIDLIHRVRTWRDNHPERCKVADAAPGEIR